MIQLIPFIIKTAIMLAISAGISYLVNKRLRSDADFGDAKRLSSGHTTTQEQGGAIQASYGTNRVNANIVAHRSSISSTMVGSLLTASSLKRTVLCCFGEGPIPEPDTATIRINGRPLTDFPGMDCYIARGLVSQAALTGWSSTFGQDFAINQTALYNSPVTYEFSTTGWTGITIHIRFPNGLLYYKGGGDAGVAGVYMKIEIGDAIADTWHTLADNFLIQGISTSTMFYGFTAALTYTGGSAFTVTAGMRPRIRVTRQTADTDIATIYDEMEVMSVQARRAIAFTHPGMVMMSLVDLPDELIEDGIHEVSMETEGKIVSDGAGGFAASRIHARAIEDVLLQPVTEGDGSVGDPYAASYYRALDPARIVEAGFTAQATLAATTADDGKGGTEALMQCDAIFGTPTSAFDAIEAICVSGRCGLRYIGRDIGLWVDTARTPVGLLCDGTWDIEGATPRPTPADKMTSEAIVSFRDAAAQYEERKIYVPNTAVDTLNSLSFTLAAVTRSSEAARMARRELARDEQCDLELSCSLDLDAVVYEPGDVLYAQIDGRSLGGRLTAVDGATVTVDRDIADYVSGTDVLIVQVRDSGTGVQSVELHDVDSVSGREVTITDAFTGTPIVGTPFLFGPSTIEDDQFEVITCEFDEHLHASMSLLKYVPALDDLDAVAPPVEVPVGPVTTPQRTVSRPKKPHRFDVATWEAVVGDGTDKPEDGADVTADHEAASIAGQGDLATLDTVDTAQIVAEAVTSIISVEDLTDRTLWYSTTAVQWYGKSVVVAESAQFESTGAPLFVTIEGQVDSSSMATMSKLGVTLFIWDTANAAINISAIALVGATQVAVTTATNHGLTTGDFVWFEDVGGTTKLNEGIYKITKTSDTAFTLDDTRSDLYAAYTTGGTIKPVTVVHARTGQPQQPWAGTPWQLSTLDEDPVDGEVYVYLAALRNEHVSVSSISMEATLIALELKR